MATLSEILSHFWPGAEWEMRNSSDYSTLSWRPGNAALKPTEAEILARSGETDALLNDAARKFRQQAAMRDTPDYLLRLAETQIDALIELRRVINDMRSTIIPAAHSGSFTAWDSDIVSRIAAWKQRLNDSRSTS